MKGTESLAAQFGIYVTQHGERRQVAPQNTKARLQEKTNVAIFQKARIKQFADLQKVHIQLAHARKKRKSAPIGTLRRMIAGPRANYRLWRAKKSAKKRLRK